MSFPEGSFAPLSAFSVITDAEAFEDVGGQTKPSVIFFDMNIFITADTSSMAGILRTMRAMTGLFDSTAVTRTTKRTQVHPAHAAMIFFLMNV
ncbi:MAG: hypothetical protein IIY74_01175 [Firmicutes bacterium]|nr:hypothetical protein [Bacillota bacterium]